MTRYHVLWLGLVLGAAQAAEPTVAVPRVAATYCSWKDGAYQFRESHDALFAGLGWPYDRVENTHVVDLVADLDRVDIFCPPNLYNYDHAQPFEQHRAAWQRFLARGGVIIGLDANYGQQLGWLTQLADGLALASRHCDAGAAHGHERRLKVAAPADPAAPPAEVGLPWAHFESHGPNWKVLATCEDGHPVCLSAAVGQGLVIATTIHTERGYPTAAYLQRLWRHQQGRLMAGAPPVKLSPGEPGVGRKTLSLTANLTGTQGQAALCCETRLAGGRWEASTVPLGADGVARAAYRTGAGRSDVRVTLTVDGQPRWWTSFVTDLPDLPARAAAVQERLATKALPADHPLTLAAAAQRHEAETIGAEAARLLDGVASAAGERRWRELADGLAQVERRAVVLAGRLQVAQSAPAARGFAVVRSEPLTKLHREQAPAGPVTGPVRLSAARGESESVQLAVVPLGADLAEVRASVSPLTGPRGTTIPASALELHRVGYVKVQGPSAGAPPEPRWWPDVLLPADRPFTVKHVSQPLWLDLTVPRSVPAGAYRGLIEVSAGGYVERVPLELEVLDFDLPEAHSLRTFYVMRTYLVSQKYFGGNGHDYAQKVPLERFLAMADVCLKRRLAVQPFGNETATTPDAVMPYLVSKRTDRGWEFDFTQTDRVLAHLRAAGQRTLYCGFAPTWMITGDRAKPYLEYLEAYLKALQPHLAEKGWLEEAVFYLPDEPWQEGDVSAVRQVAALMDRVAPKIKRLLTAPRDPRLNAVASVWVPGGLPEAHPESADERRKIDVWTKAGAEPWWYICCGPTHPYPNFFIDYPTIDGRMVSWLTWKYRKTGFLYWGVAYHGDPKEMTPDGPTEKYPVGPPNMGNGDGTLCYWGPDLTLYPSIRLDAIRDGLEDYEYLALLRRLADRAATAGQAADQVAIARRLLAVDERVLRETKGSPNFAYTLDAAPLLDARRQVAASILALQRALAR